MTENDCRILARACDLNWAIVGGISDLFTRPDDWELVRQKVVVPHKEEFYWNMNCAGGWVWALEPTPKNLCQEVVNWIKTRPDLFPWVVEMEEKK